MSAAELVALRQELHTCPEPSNREAATAERIRTFLAGHGLEPLAADVGGHGLLYSVGPRPRVLLRAELDALPIHEAPGPAHASTAPGFHHACGHDGHMAMLAGALLAIQAAGGSVYGLFQPAEETGEGAARCLEHPALDLNLDAAYAIHNVPGRPLGEVGVREGVAAVASRGLTARLRGATSHASEPHAGRNPIPAAAHLALDAVALPNQQLPRGAGGLVTLVHLLGGSRAFGTSAGDAQVSVTIRGDSDQEVEALEAGFRKRAEGLAQAHGLNVEVDVEEPFPATINDAASVYRVKAAAKEAGLACREPLEPQPWSEDFGYFLRRWPGALILLGSGDAQPALHASDYDFPDALISQGVAFWTRLVA